MSMTRAQRINAIKKTMATQLADFVRQEIKRRKLTQREFAKMAGMYPQAICRITSGALKSVHQGTLIRIYDALGVVPTIVRTKRK